MAPHIALHEAGAAFTPRPLSFRRGENRTPAFRALNPEGKVPVLVIDATPLTEVAAILFYIARRFPAARLLPAGAESEARVLAWLSFCAATLHPARRRGLDHAQAVYAIADARLAGRDWCVDEYSIADIHLFRLYWRLKASLHPPPNLFPHLDAHHARMLERAAVQRVLHEESALGYELPA